MRRLLMFYLFACFCSSCSGVGIEDISFCDGCWCVPEVGDECPQNSTPETSFDDDFLKNLRGIELENPFDLTCNPYLNQTCDTVPPLEEGGACVFEVVTANNGTAQCPHNGYSYRLKTVASLNDIKTSFETLTHLGPCGICSSFQDLAVYMEQPDLAAVGIRCTVRAIMNFQDGLACYMEEGFSKGCAIIWAVNSINTRDSCPMCVAHAINQTPNNKGPPNCELAECIQCDEDQSGPVFQKFAGRTRRRSGMLSAIVRPCSTIPSISHRDPCSSRSSKVPSQIPSTPPLTIPTNKPGKKQKKRYVFKKDYPLRKGP